MSKDVIVLLQSWCSLHMSTQNVSIKQTARIEEYDVMYY